MIIYCPIFLDPLADLWYAGRKYKWTRILAREHPPFPSAVGTKLTLVLSSILVVSGITMSNLILHGGGHLQRRWGSRSYQLQEHDTPNHGLDGS